MFDLDIELVDGFFVAAVPGHIDVKRAWDRLRARLEESGRTAPNGESAPCKHETAVCVGEMLRCEKCGVYFKE